MSRSTFSVLFYASKSKLKNGIVPIMGRVTINGTQSQFSCKQSIPLDLWDVKGNRAKGRSREALQLNRDLDNIKAQLIKHYQHLSDKEGFVTAEMVRNAYQGLGSEYETLLNAFDKDIDSLKRRVGKDRALGTYYLTVYNIEVVLLLAFRLNSYQARTVRRELMECITRNHKPFEVILTAITGKGN